MPSAITVSPWNRHDYAPKKVAEASYAHIYARLIKDERRVSSRNDAYLKYFNGQQDCERQIRLSLISRSGLVAGVVRK